MVYWTTLIFSGNNLFENYLQYYLICIYQCIFYRSLTKKNKFYLVSCLFGGIRVYIFRIIQNDIHLNDTMTDIKNFFNCHCHKPKNIMQSESYVT